MFKRRCLLLTVACLATAVARAESPCDGVSRILTDAQRAAWAPSIAKQMAVPTVDLLKAFSIGDWRIVNVDTHQSDEGFLFYDRDPSAGRYKSLWGGVAMKDEEREIMSWTLTNVPGIPTKLASCFSWYVTHNRNT